jgi:uncharacterized membrane protein
MSEERTDLQSASAFFSAVLVPHRSLGRKGFVILMSIISGLSFLTGVGFYLLGAWPVLGFFGLDVLLIYGAFRLNYRAARLYETVELTDRELRVTRIYPSGKADSWVFNPYWVRLELEENETTANRLSLRSHGRVLRFASFLSNDEKRDFAHALDSALFDMRGNRA